jgi:hypothetical protein
MWEPTTAKWVHACVDNRRLYVPLPSLGTAPRHWVIRCLQGIIFKRRHDFSQLWLIVFFGFLVADLGSKGSCKEPAKWVREPRGGGESATMNRSHHTTITTITTTTTWLPENLVLARQRLRHSELRLDFCCFLLWSTIWG